MATLSDAKMLGGLGAILMLIPFLSVVGYVLVIVAVRDVSDYMEDRAVFNNIMIAAGAGIVGAFAGAVVIAIGVIGAGSKFGYSSVAGVEAELFIAWVFLIVSAFFLRRTYNTMSQKLGVGTFRTAATLYLVGAALTIVLVGFILLLVAEIVQAIAYFSIPEETPTQEAGASPGPTAPSSNSMPPWEAPPSSARAAGPKSPRPPRSATAAAGSSPRRSWPAR